MLACSMLHGSWKKRLATQAVVARGQQAGRGECSGKALRACHMHGMERGGWPKTAHVLLACQLALRV
jgi:hypothetical protein